MPKIHPLTLNIGCASSFLHVGQVAAAAVLRKREPQKTNPENGTAGIASSTSDKAPLVVYASDSSPTAASPTITNRSVLFVVLSGASAFSLITLAFVMIYRRYKAHKFALSRSGEATIRPGGLQKSQIRHVTHDEQKERYRSLFGVPAGYLRPKSLAPQPSIQALQTAGRSPTGALSQDDYYETKEGRRRSSSSLEMNEGVMYPLSPTDSEFYMHRSRPETRVVSIVDDRPRQIWNLRSTSADTELPISCFPPRLPNLLARLKSIKPKTSYYRSKSLKRTHPSYPSSTVKPLQLDMKACATVDGIRPQIRSPSIIATPPSLIKTPSDEDYWTQKPLDLSIVTERLERHASVQRPTFRGRGDSYYWKSPPKSGETPPS